MINPSLIEHIFKAASISRWNDYPKMVDINELDKQAHKVLIAYFLAKLEGDANMRVIVEYGVFEFLSRVVVTDIRPDVLHYIQKSKADELNSWIKTQLDKIIDSENELFKERLDNFFKGDETYKKERLILKAASYLATKWEFAIVYQTSKFLEGIDELKAKVDEEIEDYFELGSIKELLAGTKLSKLIDLCGRLRFQRRWAQTQRIPQTNVLGHMLVVAIFSYFYSLEIKACDKRLENNFYCALFHDLPESLTRDIISPVKYGVKGLDDIISEYEMRLIEEQILPLAPSRIRAQFAYILGVRKDGNKRIKSEFENRIMPNNESLSLSAALSQYNTNEHNAIDGKAIKCCDRLAALIEAGLSISYGVQTTELKEGFKQTYKKFVESGACEGVDFKAVCDTFKEHFGLDF